MAQSNIYTTRATANFLRAVSQVKQSKPVIFGKQVKTDKDICTLLAMHQSSFSHIDSGKRAVTLDQLAAFCEVFGYDIRAMVYGDADDTTLDTVLKRLDALEAELETIKLLQ